MGNSVSTDSSGGGGGSGGSGGGFGPGYLNDSFWPSPNDSVETLQTKVDLNNKMAWGEIISDTAIPGHDSDYSEYAANASTAQRYLNDKTSSGNHDHGNSSFERSR